VPIKHPIEPRFLPPGPRADALGVVLYLELVGTVLRHHRERANMMQADLASILGWPQPKVSRLERGDSHLAVEQLEAIVSALNEHLPMQGDEPLHYWEVLAGAEKLASDLIDISYDVVWCSGPEWPGPSPLLRGRQLRAALALAHVPFST
jgi:predicted XRE-type DNA-binding protein